MTVAIVGGGIQGCLVALDLARRGIESIVFEARDELMDAASRWNEGKIHLGYIYANDRSLRTARRMIDGGTVFKPLLEKALGQPIPAEFISDEFVYAVHRDSMISADAAEAHLRAVDGLVEESLGESHRAYIGDRRWPSAGAVDIAQVGLGRESIVRAWQTQERSIDPQWVARAVVSRMRATPSIGLALGRRIVRLERRDDGKFSAHDAAGESHGPFDTVVNASWESRLLLDESLGYHPPAAWSHRYKLAMHSERLPIGSELASVTVMLGPFGDIVNFGAGRLYLSWYPAGRIAASTNLGPGDEPSLEPAELDQTARAIIDGLATVVPAVTEVAMHANAFVVRGGWIFAWGETDIVDPHSGLHSRHDIGVSSDRGYHSIDTGKYGMAPLNASVTARRIAGEE